MKDLREPFRNFPIKLERNFETEPAMSDDLAIVSREADGNLPINLEEKFGTVTATWHHSRLMFNWPTEREIISV